MLSKTLTVLLPWTLKTGKQSEAGHKRNDRKDLMKPSKVAFTCFFVLHKRIYINARQPEEYSH